MTILHLATPGPITDRFFPFIENNLDCSTHELLTFSRKGFGFKLNAIEVIHHANKYKFVIDFFIRSNKAEKIIIHGLFGWQIIFLFAMNPGVLKRCYWVIWGGDLYYRNMRIKSVKSSLLEILRKFVIQRIGHFVTHIEGDYKLAQQWYSAKGQWHECFMYTSNLYQDYPLKPVAHNTINIQVGNSADPSNNHLEVLEKLKVFRDENIRIYVPLSYGNEQHAQKVIEYGIKNFGNKFIPLTEFMPLEKYLDFLAKIDIAIFNHRRQQGMGNIITLLGLEKKVFIRSDVTTWDFFKNKKIIISDAKNFQSLNICNLKTESMINNKRLISIYFSSANLVRQWANIFG